MRDRSRLSGSIQVRNVHYERDVEYTMRLCRWILRPIGIWHFVCGRSSQSEKLVSITLFLVCFSVLYFVFVPSGLYVLLDERDLYVRVKLFGPVGFCFATAVKYCLLGVRSEAIGRCVERVERDWQAVRRPDHRMMMLKNASMSRRLTSLCVIFLYIGGLSYHTLVPLAAGTRSNGSSTKRPLVYPGYERFFDPQISPVYEIVFCLHCLCAVVEYNITSAACSLAAIFVTHACGQVQILMTLLDDLVEGKVGNGATMQKRLGTITRHHVRVLRFTADVEKILREICLLELMVATFTICLLEYYCMMEWQNSNTVAIVTYAVLLASFSFNVLIFCYIGELLVEEYSKIGRAAYEVNWYDLLGNKAIDLVIIIGMSHYPPKLTAGKFCDLSLNTFSTVLKSSVVYLNLLRTVTQ